MRHEDEERFVAFVTARSRALLRLAHLIVRAPDDAEDLVQTALEKAYRRWSRISTVPEPYVRRIMVNTAISRSRRRRIVAEVQMPAPPEVPFPATDGGVEVRDALMAELRRLPARQRAVIVLRYWEDLSVEETADVLGCTAGTVKSQAARGMAKLRERATVAGIGPRVTADGSGL